MSEVDEEIELAEEALTDFKHMEETSTGGLRDAVLWHRR